LNKGFGNSGFFSFGMRRFNALKGILLPIEWTELVRSLVRAAISFTATSFTEWSFHLLKEVSLSIERLFIPSPTATVSVDGLGIGVIGAIPVMVLSSDIFLARGNLVGTSPPRFVRGDVLSLVVGTVFILGVSSVAWGTISVHSLVCVEIGVIRVAVWLVDGQRVPKAGVLSIGFSVNVGVSN